MKVLLIILLLAPCMMQHGSQRRYDEIQITTSSDKARSLYLDAREFSEKMDFGNAILLINKALKIDPGFALAYLLKARQTSNYKDQVYNLRKAEELSYKAELDETEENEKLFQQFQTVILVPFRRSV